MTQPTSTTPHAGNAHCPTCICHEGTHPHSFEETASLSPSDSSVAKLDGYVEKLRGMIVDALRRRNGHAPISRLPTDILARIFVYCRDAGTALDVRWISVSQVSHAWRMSAIGHAPLWSAPNFWYPKLANEMVLRTRDTMFDLHYVMPGRDILPEHPFDSALEEVFRVSHHIKGIYVTGRLRPEIQAVILTSAAFLRTLSCTAFGRLPHDVRNAHYPRLEVVHGTHIAGDEWRTRLLRKSSNLRVIQLQGSCVKGRPEMVDVLNTLSNLPHLEELQLTDCMPKFLSFVDHIDRQIRLLSLKTLTMEGGTNDISVASFLQYLELSSHCRTTTHCFVGTDTGGPHLYRAMDSLVEHILPPACSDFLIEISEQTKALQIDAYTHGDSDQDRPHHSLILKSLPRVCLVQCLSAMALHLAGARIALTVYGDAYVDKLTWEAFLRGNEATVLHIVWGRNPTCMRLFANVLGDGDMIPSLHTLIITTSSDLSAIIPHMIPALSPRAEAGVFRELRVEGPNMAGYEKVWKVLLPGVELAISAPDSP